MQFKPNGQPGVKYRMYENQALKLHTHKKIKDSKGGGRQRLLLMAHFKNLIREGHLVKFY